MAYNGGGAYARRQIRAGRVSEYAENVLKKAKIYERRNGL